MTDWMWEMREETRCQFLTWARRWMVRSPPEMGSQGNGWLGEEGGSV